MKINRKTYWLAPLALLLAAGLWLTGCESDTVAPHDETPALTSEDVAHQAGAMSAAASRVLPQLVEFGGASKNEYSYTFPAMGDVAGTVLFDFRLGGAEGSPAVYNAADWCRMYTGSGEPIIFAVGIGGSVVVSFEVMASLVQATHTATLLDGSAGTFVAGDYTATFSFADVVVTAGDSYPSGGTMTFTSGAHTMTVTFDGDNTAVITLNEDSWVVNLDTGSVVELG